MQEIKNHIWYLKNLPRELSEAAQANYGYLRDNNVPTSSTGCLQSVIEIMQIVKEARIPPPVSQSDDEINWENDEQEQEGEQDKSKNKEDQQHSAQKGKEHERSAQKGNDEQESSAQYRKKEEH